MVRNKITVNGKEYEEYYMCHTCKEKFDTVDEIKIHGKLTGHKTSKWSNLGK